MTRLERTEATLLYVLIRLYGEDYTNQLMRRKRVYDDARPLRQDEAQRKKKGLSKRQKGVLPRGLNEARDFIYEEKKKTKEARIHSLPECASI